MNAMQNAMLDKLMEFGNDHPAVAIVAAVFGAILITVIACFRVNFMLREKAISLDDKRFKILMDVLKADKASAINPLHLELAFQRAFGRKLTSDEIVFALDRRNTSNLLFDMWHGRAFAKLTPERTGFVIKQKHMLSLKVRGRISDAIAYYLVIPGFLVALIYAIVQPVVGVAFMVEMSVFFWMMLTLARSIACARRLIENDHSIDLRVVQREASPPELPIHLHQVIGETQPRQRARTKSSGRQRDGDQAGSS